MGCVDRFFTVRNTVLSALGMLAVLMTAQAAMPVAYAADPDDPRLPHQIIEEINAVKAQFRADALASQATTSDLRGQKQTLSTEYRDARQESVDRASQINQAIRVARADFAVTRSAIYDELTTVRVAQRQLRRDYSIARRTMGSEEFAEFFAQYVVQMAVLNEQYMAVRQQLTAAGAGYRDQINGLRGQIADERAIQRALWNDFKTACGPINEAIKAERQAFSQVRAEYNATIRALNDELRAAREKERQIRENGGAWTPSDDDPDEE